MQGNSQMSVESFVPFHRGKQELAPTRLIRIRHDNMTRPLKNLGKQLRKINKINKMKNDE